MEQLEAPAHSSICRIHSYESFISYSSSCTWFKNENGPWKDSYPLECDQSQLRE